MKNLYLECYSGISGDMTVGALLDLGADPEVLKAALDSLHVEGYHISIGRAKKCGIDACDFDVILTEESPDYANDHDHDHNHEHHHEHDHEHGHHHGHDHGHEHHHEHEHEHEHAHHHAHVHRNIHDVFAVIDRLDANERVKELSREMFRVVARAESRAHGIPVDEVHFHEVGAIDSIVDVISTAVCLDNLGIDKVYVSPLYEGTGHVKCAHGMMPVPVPAVANIVGDRKLTLKITENEGEMVTPTGAAIAAVLGCGEKLPDTYRIVKTGLGAGKKDFARANVLRAMIIEAADEEHAADKESEIWKLETNIDDCSGEALGFVMDELLAEGARDVFYTPVFMKKNRPSVLLTVICMEDDLEKLEDLIFMHTTTVGIRRQKMARTVLDRRIAEVDTPLGKAHVKICTRKGKTYCYPEYEDVKQICKTRAIDFQAAYHTIAEEAKKIANKVNL